MSDNKPSKTELSTSRKILFALLTTIIVLTLIEGTLRCIAAVQVRETGMPDFPEFMALSEKNFGDRSISGWLNIPNYHKNGININSLGFRNREFKLEKDKNTFRIVCVGDSVTFGTGISGEEHTYPMVLERLLGERKKPGGRRIEVINGGVVGYASASVLSKIRFEVLALKPDMIIVCVGWNDLYLFDPEKYTPKQSSKSPVNSLRKELLKFETLKLIRNAYFSRKGNFEIDRMMPDSYKNFDPSMFRQSLKEISDTCRENHVTLVLCTLPTMLNLDLKKEDRDRIMFPYYTKDINALRYLHKKYNQTIRDVAAKESVILCDLDSQYPVESRLFTDQAHLNADGYEIFAKIVCDSISGQLKTDSVH